VPFVPLRAAVALLGVSDDTIRRRIKAGTLTARQEPTAAGFRWLVDVPADAVPHRDPHADPQHGPAESAPDPQASAGNGHAGEVAALRELVTVLRDQLDARTREVAELHVLLQRAQLPAPVGQSEPAPTTPTEAPESGVAPLSPRRWWQRLFGG
jgi:hypothetical protein